MGANPLVGVWKSAGLEGPMGKLIYDASGHMSLQVMWSGRPDFVANNWQKGTEEEKAAAYAGYHAYYGTYEVDEAKRVVLHLIEGSLFPNSVNTTLRRTYELLDSKLTLTTEDGVSIPWERMV